MKSAYARSHSLGKQPREGVGLAEHHSASFYSSQTAAGELPSTFMDNEISNDGMYDIQTDSVPEKFKIPSLEPEQKMEKAKLPAVTAVNAGVLSSDSQRMEIKQRSLEDMTHHQHWGRQISNDEDGIADEDYDIEIKGISKALSRASPVPLLGIDSDFRSLDVFQSKSALNSLSAGPSLQVSAIERVNRIEQVLEDVKRMKSEGQRMLESRLDRLEGMVEKLLQMVTTQKKDTPTTRSGSAPSSLLGDVHYGASGGEGSTQRELARGSVEDFQGHKTTKTNFYEQKRGYPLKTLEEEPPSNRQFGKAEKTRKVDFLSPNEELPPLRAMETFKGDASVRPKQRSSASRHQEDFDRSGRGTKGAHPAGKNGVLAETSDTYGDTRNARRQEAGTAGQGGGIRMFAGGLRQDSGGWGGTETGEAELEDDLEASTPLIKQPRKAHSRPLRPQPPALDEDLEEGSVVESGKTSHAFSSDTLDLLKSLKLVYSRSEVNTDPVAFRLATAVERAIHPEIEAMPPRSFGQCTVLVVDNSESMKGRPLQQAIKFAYNFLDCIERVAEQHLKEENIAIMTVGGGAKVIHHLTNDYNGLRSTLKGIRAKGQSPFLEAIVACIGIFRTQKTMMTYGRKRQVVMPRIIFVTDGKITDESQSHGADSPITDSKAKADLIRFLQSSERSIVWVPVDGADKAFMDSMANISGHTVEELGDVDFLANSFRIQLIIGQVLGCIIEMPEAPVDLVECIRSHIEVLQPTLSEIFKKVVLSSVLKSLSKRHYRILAEKIVAEEWRTGERRSCGHCHVCRAAREGHPSTQPNKGHRREDH